MRPTVRARQYEVARRSWENWRPLLQTTLLSQDTIYGDPGEVPVYEYQLPKLPGRLPDYTHNVQLVNTTLLGQDVIDGVIWIDQILQIRRLPNYNFELSLVNTTLAPPVEPLPEGERSLVVLPPNGVYLVDLRRYSRFHTQEGELQTTLLSQDTIYGDPGEVPVYEYQLPKLPRIASRKTLTEIVDLVNTTLLSQDTIYGDPGEVPIYEHQLPKLPRIASRKALSHTQEGELQTTLLSQDTIYGEPGQVPVYEWPLPKLPRIASRKALTTINDLVRWTLLSQDTIYGAPGEVPVYEWLVPRGPGRPVNAPRPAELLNILLSPPVVGLPEGERALVVLPPNGVYLVDLRRYNRFHTQEGELQTTLLSQDTIYGDPGEVPVYEWRLPVLPRIASRKALFHTMEGELQTVLLSQDTIYGDPGQVPVYEWPLPKLPGRLPDYTYRLDLVNTTLLGQDSIYGDPGQVPVYEWPLPKLPRIASRKALTGIVDLVRFTLLGQDTIYGDPGEAPVYEYQLPKLPRRLPDYSYLLDLVNTTLLSQDTIYGDPGQVPVYEWPLPKLPRIASRKALTEIVDLVRWTLLSQDTLYGEPGEVPVYEWPVPRGPRRPVNSPRPAELLLILLEPPPPAALPPGVLSFQAVLVPLPRPLVPELPTNLQAILLTPIVGLPAGTVFYTDTLPRGWYIRVVIQPQIVPPAVLTPLKRRRFFDVRLRGFRRVPRHF